MALKDKNEEKDEIWNLDEEVLQQEEKPKKKKQSILALLIKRNKLKALIILFFALVANTYAWFIYNRIVDGDITAHVKSWNVTFDGALDDSLVFELDDLYPGMEEVSQVVSLTNNGEMDATVDFKIRSVRIMDVTYEVGVDNQTSESIENELLNNYPFKISFETSNDYVSSNGGKTELRFYVKWPYESGDDALDTYWGEKSYEFDLANPDMKSIQLILDVNATQVN